MSDTTYYIFILVTSYLIGSIPCGYIIGRLNNLDIRDHGSGNIGATNVLRTLGKKWGVPCFILDFIKGLAPVLTVNILIANKVIPETAYIATSLAALGTVFGHIFTIFLKFKGGKGIATSAGCLLALAPYPLLIGIIIWIAIFYSTRYVSLASIAAAASLPVSALACNQFEIGTKATNAEIILLIFLAILAIYRHKSNITKLLNGTENRFEKRSKTNKQGE